MNAIRGMLAALIGVSILTVPAGCGGTQTSLDDPQLQLGQSVYSARCASCHGASGQGVTAPRFAGSMLVDKYPQAADQRSVVANGRNAMPKFTSVLSAEEIDAVVRYTREVLAV